MSGLRCLATELALGALPALCAAQALSVESCIGSDRFELHAGSDSALLDEVDRAGVQSAMLERYPAFGSDGLAIQAIVLWRKPETGWVYLALKPHPDKPGKVCSAASFSAAAFDFSAALQRKYFAGQRSS